LKDVYVITINDAGIDDEFLKTHWEMKQSPYEFVEWFGIKYDLDPKSAFGIPSFSLLKDYVPMKL